MVSGAGVGTARTGRVDAARNQTPAISMTTKDIARFRDKRCREPTFMP